MPEIRQVKAGEILYDIKDNTITDFTDEEIENICDLGSVNENDAIPVATNTLLGCVSIGSGLSVDTDGKISADFSGVTREFLLWENPDSSAVFPAQTVNLDLGEYDSVRILYKLQSTGTNFNSIVFDMISDDMFYADLTYADTRGIVSTVNSMIRRGVTITKNSIAFSDDFYRAGTNTTSDSNNKNLIPVKIYGIKVNRVTEVTENTVTVTDVVPVTQGGTGSMTQAGARTNLGLSGTMVQELVWTNAIPTSEFGAQTISISNRDIYDSFIVYFNSAQTGNSTYNARIKNNVGTSTPILGYFNVSTETHFGIRQRTLTIVDSGISFGDVVSKTTEQTSADNSYATLWFIPSAIYGIKILD